MKTLFKFLLLASCAMSITACDAQSPPKEEHMTDAQRQAQADKVHAELEALAKAAEPAALAQNDALFAKAKAAHEADVAGYSFTSQRWGDFLNISIARRANPKDSADGQTFSTSLNLKKIDAIRLVEGHAPDQAGVIHYGFKANHKGDSDYLLGGSGFGNYSLGPGYTWEVTPGIPWVSTSHTIFFLSPEPIGQQSVTMNWGDDSYHIKFTTEGFMRNAEDDRIIFDGVRATVYAPAGLGADIYHKFLLSTGVDAAK